MWPCTCRLTHFSVGSCIVNVLATVKLCAHRWILYTVWIIPQDYINRTFINHCSVTLPSNLRSFWLRHSLSTPHETAYLTYTILNTIFMRYNARDLDYFCWLKVMMMAGRVIDSHYRDQVHTHTWICILNHCILSHFYFRSYRSTILWGRTNFYCTDKLLSLR